MAIEKPLPKGDEDMMKRMTMIVETAMKFKKSMLKRKLRRAQAICPHCDGGRLHGTLNGRRDHIHMACDNAECEVRMME